MDPSWVPFHLPSIVDGSHVLKRGRPWNSTLHPGESVEGGISPEKSKGESFAFCIRNQNMKFTDLCLPLFLGQNKKIFVDYGFLESTVHCTCSFFRVKIAKKTSCGEIDICRESLFRIRFRIHLHGKFSATRTGSFRTSFWSQRPPQKYLKSFNVSTTGRTVLSFAKNNHPTRYSTFFGGASFFGEILLLWLTWSPQKKVFFVQKTHTNQKPRLPTPALPTPPGK